MYPLPKARSGAYSVTATSASSPATRQIQVTPDFQRRYAPRAGIEGTLSQGIRAFGLRRCRYVGFATTHLQHRITVTAMNGARLVNWWNEVPLAQTRRSQFAKLAPVAGLMFVTKYFASGIKFGGHTLTSSDPLPNRYDRSGSHSQLLKSRWSWS